MTRRSDPPTDSPFPPGSISTLDLARMRGWSRFYAHRWCTAKEKILGPPFIIRVGPRRIIRITREGLEKLAAEHAPGEGVTARHTHEIKLLNTKLSDAEKRFDALAERVIEQARALRRAEGRLTVLEGNHARAHKVTS